MPSAAKRLYTHPGCKALSKGGPCEKHKKQERIDYDARRVGDPFHKIYSTARWKRLRILKLQKDPLCERCKPAVSEASDVHHKKEIRDGGDPWNMDNLESLCHACHSRHSAESGIRWGGSKL